MDNLTHSLVGWALGETGLKRRTRKGLAACILAANMPDIDVFFGWAPWTPLATHRGFTHGLVGGVLLLPPLLAGLLWLLDRWQVARDDQFRSGLPMRFGWLVVLSYLGALTHPILDWQNAYAVQLASPLSTRWYHNDALFIIDPWVLITLAVGIWLARRRTAIWRAGRPAIAALACVAAYIALNGMISNLARRAPTISAPYADPDAVVASPAPLAFWRRDVVWRQDGNIGRGQYDPLRHLQALVDYTPMQPSGLDDPLVRRAMRDPDAVRFLRWSIMTTARVEVQGCRATVTFADARFSQGRGGRSFMEQSAIVDSCAASAL